MYCLEYKELALQSPPVDPSSLDSGRVTSKNPARRQICPQAMQDQRRSQCA